MITIHYAINVASQLHNEGKLNEAQFVLNSILETHPTHAHALHLSGIIAYQTGKKTEGIKLIQQAIKSESSVALFHCNLAEMYRQLNYVELSIECGQRAVTLDPHSATALSNLGIAYYDARLYAQAEDCHKRALAIAPHLSASLNNMGSLAKISGNMQQAITFYQAAIMTSPHFVESFNNLGSLFLEQHEFKKAFDYLNQAIKLLPTFADAHSNMGLVLLELKHYTEAQLHFEKALHHKPHHAESYYGMAKCYVHQYHFNLAESSIRKAIALKSQHIEFYQLLSEISHEQGHHAQALMHLDHALSTLPLTSEDKEFAKLCISKGSILMDMGELTSAEEAFLKVAGHPSIDIRIQAHYSLAQLHKIQADSPTLKALLSIADNIQEASASNLVYLYFALGKCHHDMKAWAKAFDYFSQGCALKRTQITYNFAEQLQFTHHLISNVTRETIDYLQRFSNPSSLPIFIVGMPRSGTTLVEQILASHPEVYGAGELTYLADLIQGSYPGNMLQLSEDKLHAITHNYLTYLQSISSSANYITDKMPQNFMAIGLIHALFPNAKIIHVKRNPLDTCLSCYTKLFSEGQYFSYDLMEVGQYYQCYENIMNHWRNILPNHAFIDVHYEDIIHDIESEAKRLIAYCQLPWDPACLAFYESKRQVKTASFMQVRKPLYTSSVNSWRRYERELAPLINLLKSRSEVINQ